MKDLLVRNVTLLRGPDFLICSGDILVKAGIIERLYLRPDEAPAHITVPNVIDGSGLIVIPSFVNSHCHVLDGPLKEKWIGHSIPELFLFGAWKYRTLAEAPDDVLLQTARAHIEQMVDYGITTACVFVEEGQRGLRIVREACRSCAMHAILLGEPQMLPGGDGSTMSEETLLALVSDSDGIGPCSSTGVADSLLQRFRNACKDQDKWTATHMAEYAPTKSFERALNLLGVRFLVHCNYLEEWQYQTLGERKVGIVCCIRSGSTFGEQTPDLEMLDKMGICFGFGTDNMFTNTPDMFRELEFITRKHIWSHKGPMRLSPERILRAATYDANRLLGFEKRGLVEEGFEADFLVLKPDANLSPFNGAISVLLRAGVQHIAYVIVGGSIVRNFSHRGIS